MFSVKPLTAALALTGAAIVLVAPDAAQAGTVVASSGCSRHWAMQNPFSTVALEPTYDAQPGPNVPLQGGSATGVMPPMKKTTMLFHALFKVACRPADAGPTAPAVSCIPAGPTRADVGPRRVHLRDVDLR